MTKKNTKKKEQTAPSQIQNVPSDVSERFSAIKGKVEKFQSIVLEKFGKYIVGITLLPPKQNLPSLAPGPDLAESGGPQAPSGQTPQKENPDAINLLVLIDDSDSSKMPKAELKEKLTAIANETAKEIDSNMAVEMVILSELWQNCFDAKYDLLPPIAMGAQIYDTGMLSAIKIAEIHKSMVLKKFEKYIVSYVLAGSLVQGRATPTSDIDVWIVIDDTDVKKMTRTELKDKLRAIIIGMGIEAGEMTGIRNKLNIQVYILTDFWDSLREANPVIFTLLRDGVPFFDRGIFMPWKQLLRMGKIKPSEEAIDIFLGSGEQVIRRVKGKLNEIGMEDIYYAILTPSQAALMLYGVAPPTPKETPQVMMDIFVKKEKLLEEKFVKILERSVTIRKGIEHGDIKELSGKELDELLDDGDKYLKRIKRLFTQIEKMKEEKDMDHLYDTVVTIMRDALKAEGTEKVSESDLVKTFESEMITSGKIPSAYLRTIHSIMKAKKDFEEGKATKVDAEIIRKDAGSFIRFLIEHIQRRRAKDFERVKIRVKHSGKMGEALLLGSSAFITLDVASEQREMSKASFKDGRIGKISSCTLEEFEKAIAEFNQPQQISLSPSLLDDLKKIFGNDVEVLLN